MIDPNELYQKLETAIEEYSKATYQFKLLDYGKKSILSQIILQQEGKSYAEREAKALASEDYGIHYKGLALAEEHYIRCKFKVQNMQSYMENLRTQEVSMRKATS